MIFFIILLVALSALFLGIWLGRTYCRPLSKYNERLERYEEELKEQIYFKVKAEEAELLKQFYQQKQQLNEQYQLTKTNLNNEISNLHQQQAEALITRKLLSEQIDSLQKQIASLMEQKEESLSNYNKSVVQAKKRMILNARRNYELELQNLEFERAETLAHTNEAINLIKSKMAEWSNAERIAYEERCNRAETQSRNKLALSSRSIEELQELYGACGKLKLTNPVPLYKAIYELYFRGPVKDLGVRLNVVGQCGIYKLTNVLSGKVYIGQSVDIAERWKQHIKRGTKCDIGTLSGAGLYEAMWEEGVWNFSFELLEECEKDKLNEREKFWIAHFQSNEIGYNKRA